MVDPEQAPATLGAKLGQARKALGLTQEKIAADVGVSQNTWSTWERDDALPSDVGTMLSIIDVTKKAPKHLRIVLVDFQNEKKRRQGAA
jgi:transcriptional regulator with XRE-family HTH domain